MKCKPLMLWPVIILACLLFISPDGLADDNRFVEIRKVIIDAEVLPDGSVAVEEERTYYFGGGQFRGADQWFYFTGDISYEDISLREGDTKYSYVETFPTTEPGTYSTEYHSDHFVLDYSFDANNEEKTFTISYILRDAVTVHEDVAEIYHQFIGDEWNQATRYAFVDMRLPEGAAEDEVKAWGHGPLHGEVTIHGPRHITWELEDLSPRRFLEVRTVFPPELVPDATNKTGEPGLEAILAEEKRWARQANLERTLHRIQWIFGPVLFVFLIIYSILTFRKVKEGTNAYEGDYYRELPGEYPPAVAGYLIRHAKTDTEDFTATIMDLARRKFIRIEEVTTKKGLLKRESTDYLVIKLENDGELAPYEKRLMDFMFNQVAPVSDWANRVTRKEYSPKSSGNEPALTFDDIKNYSRKNQMTVKSFFQNWKNEIQTEAQKQNFFENKMSGLQYRGLIIGVVLFFAGIALALLTEFFIMVFIFIFSGVLLFILMLVAGKPFSEKGADQCSKWKAFKRFLLHFSSMDQSTIPSLIIWEHYLVYAVTLGVAKEVMKQLKVVFPDLEEQSRRMGMSWYAMGMMGTRDFTGSFDRMTDSLNSTMRDSYKAAFKSSSSSGSGGGGGFSGGGGGGSGGGGGGFR